MHIQVYDRLQKLHLATSSKSVTRLIHQIGQDFDADVREWRDQITAVLEKKVGNEYIIIFNNRCWILGYF